MIMIIGESIRAHQSLLKLKSDVNFFSGECGKGDLAVSFQMVAGKWSPKCHPPARCPF